MNRSPFEVLVGNTPPNAIARLRREWVEPGKAIVREMDRDTVCKHARDLDPRL